MIEIPSLRPETRYGMPAAERVLFNRQYVVGYSYLFRQPRWALELIDDHTMQMEDEELERLDNFREDLRIEDMFRATLDDYKGAAMTAATWVSSADRLGRPVVNSETFLMTNMSPQKPGFNRGIWKNLESAVRKLAAQEKYVEVYAICGPLFKIGDPIQVIGENHVVVPDAYFKSVLAEEKKTGKLRMWTFSFPNEKTNKPLSDFLVPTQDVERRAGLMLWDRLRGSKSDRLRQSKGRMWAKA